MLGFQQVINFFGKQDPLMLAEVVLVSDAVQPRDFVGGPEILNEPCPQSVGCVIP
jgi:hypothetical protein